MLSQDYEPHAERGGFFNGTYSLMSNAERVSRLKNTFLLKFLYIGQQ